MKYLLLATITALACTAAKAQPYLDSFNINTATTSPNSNPLGLVAEGTNIYFLAFDSTHGNELWAMYGHTPAPARLTNFKAPQLIQPNNTSIAVIKGTVFFSAFDTAHGYELWYKDATGSPTMAKDIFTGKNGSGSSNFITYNGRLYFTATSKEYGSEIWCHDHAAGTTERLTDIAQDSLSSFPRELTFMNNKLYFQALTKATGSELFEYNPADKTTKLVADIHDTTLSSNPFCLTPLNNKLYFFATTTSHGMELYSYDGTNPPTRLTDLYAGQPNGVYPGTNMQVYNGKIYFSGWDNNSYHLYTYDPLTNKASLAAKINPNTNSSIDYLTVFNNALYFAANDGTTGIELWKYDTAPTRITDLVSGNGISNINAICATPHALFFVAKSNVIGVELFRLGNSKVDVEHVSFNADVKVYPNPASDVAHVQMKLDDSRTLNISVTDISGRVVYSTGNVLYSASQHMVDVPMHNLAAGTYLYRISNAEGTLMAGGKLQKL